MFNYKRVIVVGCPGAGKSVFSRKLHDATNLELFHLDAVYWNEDCTHITRNELIEKQVKIFEKNSFIIDGNFKSTLEMSTKEALVREVKEELNIDITDYKAIWVNECFFIEEEKQFHEIGMYYLVNLDDTAFNHFELQFTTLENERINYYEWLNIDSVDNVTLYPSFIKKEIKNLDEKLKLIITREV